MLLFQHSHPTISQNRGHLLSSKVGGYRSSVDITLISVSSVNSLDNLTSFDVILLSTLDDGAGCY